MRIINYIKEEKRDWNNLSKKKRKSILTDLSLYGIFIICLLILFWLGVNGLLVEVNV